MKTSMKYNSVHKIQLMYAESRYLKLNELVRNLSHEEKKKLNIHIPFLFSSYLIISTKIYKIMDELKSENN